MLISIALAMEVLQSCTKPSICICSAFIIRNCDVSHVISSVITSRQGTLQKRIFRNKSDNRKTRAHSRTLHDPWSSQILVQAIDCRLTASQALTYRQFGSCKHTSVKQCDIKTYCNKWKHSSGSIWWILFLVQYSEQQNKREYEFTWYYVMLW